MSKVLTWTCPVCGKTLTSLFERQLENNKRIHQLTHEASDVPKTKEGEK